MKFLLYCPFQLVTALIQYGGRNVRSSDLFGQNKTPLSLTRRFFKGLKVCVCICLNITFQKNSRRNRKLNNFNLQWTKTLYQNNLNNIAFCFTFFKSYRFNSASYPDVSLSMKICAQRKAGRRQRARRRFACRLYPSHGPLRFIISHSRFALASAMWKSKRLRRRLDLISQL